MDCKTFKDGWESFLGEQVPTDVRSAMEQHLADCQACQSLPVVDAKLANLLRTRLGQEKAPADLRARIVAAIAAEGAAAAEEQPLSAAPLKTQAASGSSASWINSLLGSAWAPRLAMAAVLVFVVLVPVRSLFRSPAMATEAVHRHEHHMQAASVEALLCCNALSLRPGDVLGDPSVGARVPDLSADGLTLSMASRCDYGGVDVTILAYRSEGEESFSLYITDRALENFQTIRSQQSGGIRQARAEVNRSEVTIWEKAGLVWFWIGPRSNPEYSTALADLRTL